MWSYLFTRKSRVTTDSLAKATTESWTDLPPRWGLGMLHGIMKLRRKNGMCQTWDKIPSFNGNSFCHLITRSIETIQFSSCNYTFLVIIYPVATYGWRANLFPHVQLLQTWDALHLFKPLFRGFFHQVHAGENVSLHVVTQNATRFSRFLRLEVLPWSRWGTNWPMSWDSL